MCTSENRYCQEAVDSVTIVGSCPTTKAEWDAAARRKDCSKIASTQKCSAVDQFVYHCVINGYRNVTVEVCAPSRIVFGNYNFIYKKKQHFIVVTLIYFSYFFFIFFLATLGHCVEFNVGGGVIQDQRSAECNDTFPKCESIYDSVDAYKCNAIKKK